MRRALRSILAATGLVAVMMTGLAHAVQPDEVMSDPAMESRARGISAHLRCMVCQNQSIDDSDADLARDLRLLVRERLTDGDSDEQVIDFVVARYGEFVLLKPRLNGSTILLWASPILLLLIGGGALALRLRRSDSVATTELDASEKAQLDRILQQQQKDQTGS